MARLPALILPFLLAGGVVLASCTRTSTATDASLVIVNARIYTVDADKPEAQALAIRGDRLAVVGTNDEALELRGLDTHVIDAGGRAVIPGLHDAHGHVLGALCVLMIDRFSRVRSDAALAIVLSLFYGGGTVLLSIAQRLDAGSQAGLKGYLSGTTASLVAADAQLSAVLAAVVLVITLALFKEWTLLCFDDRDALASMQREMGRIASAHLRAFRAPRPTRREGQGSREIFPSPIGALSS